MVTIGVIGTGSMGGMLIRKFIETGVVSPGNIIASNRSPEKVKAIAGKTGIRAGKNNLDVATRSDVIFICVKPLEVKGVLKELKEVLTADKLVVSIAGDVMIDDITSLCAARIAKVIPSITLEVSKGVSLVTFSTGATKADKDLIISIFSKISRTVEIEEKNFDIFAQLTSCAPAYIAAIMQEFALSAVRRGDISPELAGLVVKETLAGTAELLKDGSSFEDVIVRVATRGGITEEGVKVIRKKAPAMYDEILEATMEKHRLVKEKVKGHQ